MVKAPEGVLLMRQGESVRVARAGQRTNPPVNAEEFTEIIPKSPCNPSAEFIKTAYVPVDANVAAIFFPINPDFPIPVTTTFPLILKLY